MPESPELEVYAERLRERAGGQRLTVLEVRNVFTLRTADPPIDAAIGRTLRDVRRRGKRLVLTLDDVHLVIHLMLAGRLQWKPLDAPLHRRHGCVRLAFETGAIHFVEATTRRQASLHLARTLDDFPDSVDLDEALRRENRRIKRALGDVGIGNAYGDEFLHAARLSPMKLTHSLTRDEIERLRAAIADGTRTWIDRIKAATPDLPHDQKRWRSKMAVHGRFKKPCPACGTRIERIRYAEKETHYCPTCQTGGKKLADRGLSRLLK